MAIDWNNYPPPDPLEPFQAGPPPGYGPLGVPDSAGMGGIAPEPAPQEQVPDGFWSRIAAMTAPGEQAFHTPTLGQHPTGLGVLLAGLTGFANAKTTLAARGAADVEARNARGRQAASDLAKMRWEQRKFQQQQEAAKANLASNAALKKELAAQTAALTGRGLDIRQQVANKPPAPSNRMVQVLAPDGSTVWMPSAKSEGQVVGSPKKSVSGSDRQALSYFNRAANSIRDLETPGPDGKSLERRMAEQGLIGQMQLQSAPNMAQTEEQRAYRQAQRAFTEARLRKESGAAIPQQEYQNDARTYFMQPGDNDATTAQKQRARQAVLDGLRNAAGPAYEEFYGETPPTPSNAKKSGGKPAPSGGEIQWGRDAKGNPVPIQR